MEDHPSAEWTDVRGVGFPTRAPLEDAFAWLDSRGLPEATERIARSDALGRILVAPIIAPRDLPPRDLASIDGVALAAADTSGAGAYNPLPFTRGETAGSFRAVPLSQGSPLPEGADAVLGFSAVLKRTPPHLDVLAAAAPGEGVEQRGTALAAGVPLLPAGHRLLPQDLALLAMLRHDEVLVRAHPRVGIVIPGPKGAEAEALSAMLTALVIRDGGRVLGVTKHLAKGPDPDILVIAGRSSAGEDDDAVPRLVGAGGRIALHGIALRPGGSAGLGFLGRAPVVLLPGRPLAAFVTYDVLAARLLRRFAGLAPGLPYPRADFPLRRKIVSAIGTTDVVPVAIADGKALPLARAETARLPIACQGAGFVVVPEGSEGYAPGETVTVHLYGGMMLLL